VELARLVATGEAHDALAGSGAGAVAVVTGSPAGHRVDPAVVADLPAILVAVGDHDAEWADLVASADEVEALVDAAAGSARAATSLAILLRGQPTRTVAEGLAAESATYSTLQAGPEFAAWRAARPVVDRQQDRPAVRIERDGGRLVVTLARPEVHNAFSAAVREDLLDALAIARHDPSVTAVELRGDGPSFCSGGDLDEFGSLLDPATAHLVRLTRSAGRAVHQVADRTTAFVHGATMGSGIELAAFAHRVVAHPDTRFALPELALGLVPGAGGTVSVTRRIGRHRTFRLALSAEPIDARTALAWGLVDELSR
jgi:hypothetical protein